MNVWTFRVTVVGTDWHQDINSTTPGQAKMRYYHDLRDSWQSIPFTALRVRKIGRASSSDEFLRVARYRGLPEARCGSQVKVGDEIGIIVGHNSSANFDVLFESGRYRGQVLNVHPAGLVLVAAMESPERDLRVLPKPEEPPSV